MIPNNHDFLGGLFDFNGDGRTDPGEMFIAYKIFEAQDRPWRDVHRLQDL